MKKVLFGIFAHPDDEAFGPGASLYKAAHQDNSEVHLVLVTDGEAGTNCDNKSNLAEIRQKEWLESGKLIGATSNFALHYPDGGLSNNVYLEIADKILDHIKDTLKKYMAPLELSLMTFDHDGITGHLDHIAVSYIVTNVYLKLKELALPNVSLGHLKYYCLPHSIAPNPDNKWLYMPCGKKRSEVDEVFDYSKLKDKKLEIMKTHYSQRADMESILKMLSDPKNPACHCDHFRYFKD